MLVDGPRPWTSWIILGPLDLELGLFPYAWIIMDLRPWPLFGLLIGLCSKWKEFLFGLCYGVCYHVVRSSLP